MASDVQPPKAVISPRLAKAMANELRVKILVELNKRIMSPSEFLKCCGDEDLSLSKVAHHFRVLEKYDCIEKVGEKSGGKRRGSVEHFFRAIQQSIFDESSFANLPDSIKRKVTGVTFSTYIDRVAQAMEAGTIDARDDSHFTWTAQTLDQQGWDELIAAVDALFQLSIEIQVASGLRMAASGEKPIPVTVALAAFESPKTPATRR